MRTNLVHLDVRSGSACRRVVRSKVRRYGCSDTHKCGKHQDPAGKALVNAFVAMLLRSLGAGTPQTGHVTKACIQHAAFLPSFCI